MTLVERLRDAAARVGYYDERGEWVNAEWMAEAADAIEKAERQHMIAVLALTAAEARLEKAERLAEAVRIDVGLAEGEGVRPQASFRRHTHERMKHTSAAGTPLSCRTCEALAEYDGHKAADAREAKP